MHDGPLRSKGGREGGREREGGWTGEENQTFFNNSTRNALISASFFSSSFMAVLYSVLMFVLRTEFSRFKVFMVSISMRVCSLAILFVSGLDWRSFKISA